MELRTMDHVRYDMTDESLHSILAIRMQYSSAIGGSSLHCPLHPLFWLTTLSFWSRIFFIRKDKRVENRKKPFTWTCVFSFPEKGPYTQRRDEKLYRHFLIQNIAFSYRDTEWTFPGELFPCCPIKLCGYCPEEKKENKEGKNKNKQMKMFDMECYIFVS